MAAGGGIAAVLIAIDEYHRHRGASFRAPVLAVAVGIYLPLELSVPARRAGGSSRATGRITRALEIPMLQDGIRRRIVEGGRFYLSRAVLGGRVCLRVTLMSPFTSEADLDALLDEVRRAAAPGG